MGLPDGEEMMTLAFFVLAQYRRVTDGQTDTLRSLFARVKMNNQKSVSIKVRITGNLFSRPY